MHGARKLLIPPQGIKNCKLNDMSQFDRLLDYTYASHLHEATSLSIKLKPIVYFILELQTTMFCSCSETIQCLLLLSSLLNVYLEIYITTGNIW